MSWLDFSSDSIAIPSTSGSQSQKGSASSINVSAGDDQNATVTVNNEVVDSGVLATSERIIRDAINSLFGGAGEVVNANQALTLDFARDQLAISNASNERSVARLLDEAARLGIQQRDQLDDTFQFGKEILSDVQGTLTGVVDLVKSDQAASERNFSRAVEQVNKSLVSGERVLTRAGDLLLAGNATNERTLARAGDLQLATQASNERALATASDTIKGALAAGERAFDDVLLFGKTILSDASKTLTDTVTLAKQNEQNRVAEFSIVNDNLARLVSLEEGNNAREAEQLARNTNFLESTFNTLVSSISTADARADAQVRSTLETAAEAANTFAKSEATELTEKVVMGVGIIAAAGIAAYAWKG